MKQRTKHVYTLTAGRCIVRDGVPIATLHKVGSDAAGYTLSPVEADALAHHIVDALQQEENLMEFLAAFDALERYRAAYGSADDMELEELDEDQRLCKAMMAARAKL